MDSLYSRYANGLFSIALEENKVDLYRKRIKIIKNVFEENDDFLHLLSSCFISNEEKDEIIDKVFKSEEEYIRNFLKIIFLNKRGNCLIKILNEFIKTCNENLNIKDGIVYSVNKLSNKQIERIQESLSARLNCQVELTNSIDEKLLGGVKVTIEDKIFDGSIKNKLEKLKESLISGGN